MTIANPTLVAGSSAANFLFSGNKTLTLYNVQRESVRKTAGFIDLPMPVSDSNKKLVFDLMGTSREVTIEGRVTLSELSSGNIYKYARDLVGLKATYNTLLSGTQGDNGGQAGWVYTSSILNEGDGSNTHTMTVYVQDVGLDWAAGDPNSFTYTLTLVECDASSSA